MIKKILLLLLLLGPSSIFAADQMLVDDLFEKSGLKYQTSQIPAGIVAGMQLAQEQEQQLDKNEFSMLIASASEAFNAEFISKVVKQGFISGMSNKEVNGVLSWFNSPLGERITTMEEKASTPEAIGEMQSYFQSLQSNPPRQSRLDLIKQLDIAASATEISSEIVMNMQLTTISGMMAMAPPDKQGQLAALKTELYANKNRMIDSMRKQFLMTALYTYKDISDKELEKYVAFSASPDGKKYQGVSVGAMKVAFDACGEKMGLLLGMALDKKSEKVSEVY